ncbi:MAG: Two component regulator propeller [Bacteroidetes bacterium ADurb.Bin397]|jgi:ligand-binding sensor domain-containing protein|nr:MAG: Two component regulator propeller [Bacteroidetes bacterium ADurb.Bin397]
MIRKFIAGVFLMVLPFLVTGQQAWTVYNTQNSPLPENSVRCIAVAPNGTKWVGTDYGLASFDDVNWTVYQTFNSSIPDNSIRSLAVDANNDVWIGTFTSGLVKFDGTNWTIYNMANSDLPDDFVRCLEIDTLGNLWVGTIGGLAYFDGTNWDIYNTSNSVLGSNNIGSIYVKPEDNSAYFGTINGGLAIKDASGWSHFTIWNSNLPDNTILGLVKDTSEVLWMATPAAGLSGYIGGIAFITYNTSSSNITTNSLTCISIDSDEYIWSGSNDSGIVKQQGISNFISYNTLNSGMPDNFVQAITTDDQGVLWIGTQIGGLVRFDESILLSVPSIANKSQVKIFPIPAAENLYISSEEKAIDKLQLTDITGRVIPISPEIISEQLFQLNTSQLSSGTYLFRIIYKDGIVDSRPVVIQQ